MDIGSIGLHQGNSDKADVIKELERPLEIDEIKVEPQIDLGEIFYSEELLSNNEQSGANHTPKKTFICDICKKVFMKKSNLTKHLQRHVMENAESKHQYKKFMIENFDMTCDLCSVKCVSISHARRHYKEFHHMDNGFIKCCDLKFYSNPTIMQHIAAHLNPDEFKCDLCDFKSFRGKKDLEEHKQRHKGRTFICDMCRKSFLTKDTLRGHISRVHIKSNQKCVCSICHKRFQHGKSLETHFKCKHDEQNPRFTCEICAKNLKSRRYLDMHVLKHTGKFVGKECEHCGEYLSSPRQIYAHNIKHNSGPQKCEHCQKEYPNKFSLQYHIRTFHRERTFKCSHCERSFSTRGEWKKHEESHTRHNIYPCAFCTKLFNIRHSLRTHCKRHHPEEYKTKKGNISVVNTI